MSTFERSDISICYTSKKNSKKLKKEFNGLTQKLIIKKKY